jgi:hypothetical protein
MGQVEAIHIAPAASVAMQPRTAVEAIVGVGLAEDRYARGIGFYSPRPTEPGAREVTLFEAEVLDALRTEHGIALSASEHRRNVTVRGVRLRELIGQRFQIGSVVLEGVLDCPPCEHLQGLAGKPVLGPLVECGGIRARILEGGTIHVGDALTVSPHVASPV